MLSLITFQPSNFSFGKEQRFFGVCYSQSPL
nr:MAG TPA: hypothetical protein [Caudoviricetes sp.]